MKNDLISKRALLEKLFAHRRELQMLDNTQNADLLMHGLRIAEMEIQAAPASADVRPVVHGKWIHTTQPMGWQDEECAECSACGEDFVLDEWAMDDFTNLMHFCPNCGADMREAKE